MAINKTATNITVKLKDSYISTSGKLIKTAESVNIESTKDNLSLVSNMKIQTLGKNG